MEWSRSLLTAIVGIVLLLSPTAVANSGEGYFVVDGDIALPEDAHLGGTALGAFLPSAADLAGLTIRADRAHVMLVEREYVVAQVQGSPALRLDDAPRTREWNLTGFELSLERPATAGWLGVYGSPETRLTVAATREVETSPRDLSHIGNTQSPLLPAESEQRGWGEPYTEQYRTTVAEDHFFVSTPGSFVVEGASAIKLYGPAVRIVSDQLTMNVGTGATASEGVPPRETSRWLVVYLTDGEAAFDARGDVDVLLTKSRASWSGTAELIPVRGRLNTEEGSYEAEGRSVFLTGDFSATLAPRREADRLLTTMSVSGTLAGTTLTPQAAATRAPGGVDGMSWLPLLLFGAVLATGGVGAAYALTRRKRVEPVVRAAREPAQDVVAIDDDGLQADDCMRFADEAAAERRWARALHWAQRARKLAPGNARIRADEGEYLFQLGLFEEAMKALGEASRLDGTEGYADYRGAQAAVSAGRPMDEVLEWLMRALDRSPDLVGDLELFREFDSLRGDPRYDEMVLTAYARLGIDPAPQA